MYKFQSVQEHFTTGKGGSVNKVVITDGKGYKEHAKVAPSGKILRKSRHTLKRGELKKIANKQFVPRLWKCCSARKTTRKQRRA
jgi:hypothetical protein